MWVLLLPHSLNNTMIAPPPTVTTAVAAPQAPLPTARQRLPLSPHDGDSQGRDAETSVAREGGRHKAGRNERHPGQLVGSDLAGCCGQLVQYILCRIYMTVS